MLRNRAIRRQRVSIAVFLAGLLNIAVGATAMAADHFVSSGISTVDCRANDVEPGDTITLEGGNRGTITFNNCIGTASNRIVIRNDTAAGSRTTIQGTGKFGFDCAGCEWVTIDGTGKWLGAPAGECGYPNGRNQCGIKIQCSDDGSDAIIWLRLSGSSKNVTIQGVEVDGGFPNCDPKTPGIGISVNDHKYKLADHPGEWREGIVIQRNYVHHTASECVYVGPNQTGDGVGDLQLRNNEIGFNLIENCGWDGIELKSTVQGRSAIHHNIVRVTGLGPGDNTVGNNGHGISLFESGYTDVHHNWVQDTRAKGSGGACFTQYIQSLTTTGTVPSYFFNNVAVNCHRNGISTGRQDTVDALPIPTIINNTVIEVGGVGVSANSNVTGDGAIRDNIVCNSDKGDVSSFGKIKVSNNRTGICSANRFADFAKRDFRLTPASPAVDRGTPSGAPSDDYNGVSRPQGRIPDQGAFELIDGGGGGTLTPKAPRPRD